MAAVGSCSYLCVIGGGIPSLASPIKEAGARQRSRGRAWDYRSRGTGFQSLKKLFFLLPSKAAHQPVADQMQMNWLPDSIFNNCFGILVTRIEVLRKKSSAECKKIAGRHSWWALRRREHHAQDLERPCRQRTGSEDAGKHSGEERLFRELRLLRELVICALWPRLSAAKRVQTYLKPSQPNLVSLSSFLLYSPIPSASSCACCRLKCHWKTYLKIKTLVRNLTTLIRRKIFAASAFLGTCVPEIWRNRRSPKSQQGTKILFSDQLLLLTSFSVNVLFVPDAFFKSWKNWWLLIKCPATRIKKSRLSAKPCVSCVFGIHRRSAF